MSVGNIYKRKKLSCCGRNMDIRHFAWGMFCI